jgi:Flp pilus assembly pilin Flp
MSHRSAARLTAATHRLTDRVRSESGQGTVEYAGLAMAIGVLLLAVGSYLGGKDHGIGGVVTRPDFPNEATVSFDVLAMQAGITSRVCTGCGVVKPLTEFHRHKVGRGGVRPRCKACVRDSDPRRIRHAASGEARNFDAPTSV